MMEPMDLGRVAAAIAAATTPEDLFGLPDGEPQAQLRAAYATYRRLARVCHPDLYHEDRARAVAAHAFAALAALWAQARAAITDGRYGRRATTGSGVVWVCSPQRTYRVGERIAAGAVAALYRGACQDGVLGEVLLKVARRPAENDLLENEAAALHAIGAGPLHERYGPYFPTLQEDFAYRDPAGIVRRVNVFGWMPGLYSLAEVAAHYPRGIDARDMAWIWRRLLVALGMAHRAGVIHGAVLPAHVLVLPAEHGLILIDWCYAVTAPGGHVAALPAGYRGWYPPEVPAKGAASAATDIYLAARTMLALLGGDPRSAEMPPSVPGLLRAHLRACLLASPRQRPDDAWALRETFDDVIERLWGPRAFHPFAMPPTRASGSGARGAL